MSVPAGGGGTGDAGLARALSVIVPVRDSAGTLARCLDGLAASSLAPLDLVVVVDGSTDASAEVARGRGALVVEVPGGPRGPAVARNLGATRARGDVLFFLDADVVVHPDTVERFVRCLDEQPEVAAAFGSYDDAPSHPSIVSRYRNLLHHFVHQQGQREAATFWAGCGVVRRRAFEAVGGFDEQYRRPSIEDIDLGVRLRQAGFRIRLRPEIQATHLKRWTFTGMVRADVRDRAVPWTRLIFRQGRVPGDLNTSWASRVSAGVVWMLVAAACAAAVWPSALWLVFAALVALAGLNRQLYAFFLRKGGVWFAACSMALHALYLAYSSATFVLVGGVSALARRRGARVP